MEPGAFEVVRLADVDTARAAIEDREVYGSIVLDAAGGQMLTAPAASPAVASALVGVADAIGAAQAEAMGIEVPA